MGKRIVMMGPPGSGKGTQARMVAARLGVPHISTGDILRAELASGSELGVRAAGYWRDGGLVPDDLILEIVARRLAAPDAAGGWVLDGFPRTRPQAVGLDEMLARTGGCVDRALYLDVPAESVRRRAADRRICSKPGCQATYGLSANPPKRPGFCDVCGSPLTSRGDDRPEAVEARLTEFSEKTLPAVAYYRGRSVLSEVNGDRPPGEVAAEIGAALAAGSACGGNR